MAPCKAVSAAIFCVVYKAIDAEDRHSHMLQLQLRKNTSPAAEVGLCGCEQVPEDQCTCDRSLQYLKCIEKRCQTRDCNCPASPFLDQCNVLAGTCGAELRLSGCDQSLTTCAGRFHQASHGVIGFTLDKAHLDDQAYCGPFGRCTGELRVIAKAHRQPPGSFLECVLPAVAGQAHRKAELVHCAHELSAEGVAECSLPMIAQLEPSQEVSGRCYLTNGDGMKFTKDAWFVVRNRYGEDISAVASSKKIKKRERKKHLKSSVRKSMEARKAEEDDEAVEASEEETAEGANKENEEASVQSMKKSKRTRATWDSNMVIVLLAVIAAIGAVLIYLKSKKVTS